MATGSVSPKAGKIVDIPDTPTIGTATAGEASASLTFTAPTVGGPIRTYTALSSPGSITGTGTTSPISITGLTGGTAYTFQIRAENATGNSPYSSASNSVTPTVSNSYESIATVSVGSGGSANVEFTSIPNTYTHLQIRVLSRNDRAATNFNNIAFQVNSDTGANYNSHLLRGDGSSVIAAADTSATSIDFIIQPASGATANVMGAFVLDILDYANTNKFKTFRGLLGVDNNGSGYSGLMSAAWRSTSAITSIKFFPSSGGNITQYSHFALYGIKAA